MFRYRIFPILMFAMAARVLGDRRGEWAWFVLKLLALTGDGMIFQPLYSARAGGGGGGGVLVLDPLHHHDIVIISEQSLIIF